MKTATTVLWLAFCALMVYAISENPPQEAPTLPYICIVAIVVTGLTFAWITNKVTQGKAKDILNFNWDKGYELENEPITAERAFVLWYIIPYGNDKLLGIIIESALRSRIREQEKSETHNRLREEIQNQMRRMVGQSRAWVDFLDKEAAIFYGGKQRANV